MNQAKKTLLILTAILTAFFGCKQENILFYPEKLPADYQFSFNEGFEELYFRVDSKTVLNGLLFKSEAGKGLVFYLHGNAGSIRSWGEIAGVYLDNGYDFFILDYRGYGKSQGRISGEKQLFRDVQSVYNSMKEKYKENKIVIIGYSIGTGPAAWLASDNRPKLLILKAPFYNFEDLAHQYFSFVPAFALKYKMRTDLYIQKVRCPVVIFHGDSDEVIYYGSSLKLQELFKKGDRLITLSGQKHNGINGNPVYLEELKKLLR